MPNILLAAIASLIAVFPPASFILHSAVADIALQRPSLAPAIVAATAFSIPVIPAIRKACA